MPVTIPEVKQMVKKAQVEDTSEALVEKQVQERLDVILQRLGNTARNGLPARLRNADNQAKWKAFRARNQEKLSKVVKFATPDLTLEDKIEAATAFGADILFDSKILNFGDWSAKMKARFGGGITPFLGRVWNEAAILADLTMRGKTQRLAQIGEKAEPGAKPAVKKQKRQTITMTAEAGRLVREWLVAPVVSAEISEPTQKKFGRSRRGDAAHPEGYN